MSLSSELYLLKLFLSVSLSTTLVFVILAIFGIAASGGFASGRRNIPRIVVLLLSLALIGTCAGIAGGMSRDSAVGDIIPALFALLGGIAIYLFGVDESRGTIASLTGACLATSLFVSYVYGSQIRNRTDEYRDARALCMKVYTDPDVLASPAALKVFDEDKQFKDYCKSVMRWDLPG